jgi:hypothetical protein
VRGGILYNTSKYKGAHRFGIGAYAFYLTTAVGCIHDEDFTMPIRMKDLLCCCFDSSETGKEAGRRSPGEVVVGWALTSFILMLHLKGAMNTR